MKFDLSEDQALLRQSTRELLTNEYPLERNREIMEKDPRGYDAHEWERLAEMGYLGLLLPAAVGGQGLGTVELAIVLEEAGRACMPGPYLDAVLAGQLLLAAGGQDVLLADLCAGKQLVTMARADAPFAGTTRSPTRYEGARLRGTKYFVPFAAQSDALLVTTPEGIFVARSPFAVVPMQTFDLAQRFGAVTFDHPATRLGAPALLERIDQLAAVGAAAMLLGLMSHCLERTLE